MMNDAFHIALEALSVLALVAINGFFVATEFALVKIRSSQLRPMVKTGGWRVKFALKATEHLDAALSATQLGVTLARNVRNGPSISVCGMSMPSPWKPGKSESLRMPVRD